VTSSRPDTVTGIVTADDADGLDSIWVTVGTAQQATDGGFDRTLSFRYRLVVPSGQQPGAQVPMSFRARDALAFEARKDTYVVVVP
jgi:hypothetical protein